MSPEHRVQPAIDGRIDDIPDVVLGHWRRQDPDLGVDVCLGIFEMLAAYVYDSCELNLHGGGDISLPFFHRSPHLVFPDSFHRRDNLLLTFIFVL